MSLYNQYNHVCEIFFYIDLFANNTLHDKLEQWLLIIFFGKRKKYTVPVTGDTIDDKKPHTNN